MSFRVAVITENLGLGGINRYCLDLTQGLKSFPQVECSLFALPSAGDDWLLRVAASRGLTVETLGADLVRSLRRLVAERHVDIVHTQGYRANTIARVAGFIRSVLPGRGAFGQPPRLVCTVHGAHYFSTAALRSKCYYLLDYLTMFSSDRVIAVSAATEERVRRWVRDGRLHRIYNGTPLPALPSDQAKLAYRRGLGLSETAKIVCFAGRLSPQKGVAALVGTAETLLASPSDVVFLVVGDGELRSQVEECARAHPGHVVLAGNQPDIQPYYAASDVFLLPSRTEGLPMALLEAQAWGLPAVASRVGGVPEVLSDGQNGFLCAGEDTRAMASRLSEILADDRLRASMGANARATVESRFSLAAMVAATYELYEGLVGSN